MTTTVSHAGRTVLQLNDDLAFGYQENGDIKFLDMTASTFLAFGEKLLRTHPNAKRLRIWLNDMQQSHDLLMNSVCLNDIDHLILETGIVDVTKGLQQTRQLGGIKSLTLGSYAWVPADADVALIYTNMLTYMPNLKALAISTIQRETVVVNHAWIDNLPRFPRLCNRLEALQCHYYATNVSFECLYSTDALINLKYISLSGGKYNDTLLCYLASNDHQKDFLSCRYDGCAGYNTLMQLLNNYPRRFKHICFNNVADSLIGSFFTKHRVPNLELLCLRGSSINDDFIDRFCQNSSVNNLQALMLGGGMTLEGVKQLVKHRHLESLTRLVLAPYAAMDENAVLEIINNSPTTLPNLQHVEILSDDQSYQFDLPAHMLHPGLSKNGRNCLWYDLVTSKYF